MDQEYSAATCKKLKNKFQRLSLYRPMRVSRHDEGDQLSLQVNDVSGKNTAQIKLKIDKFVGGGFAGQVYKVKILKINHDLISLTQ